MKTFFLDEDYGEYLALMAEWCGKCGVEIWAYCLMPNHTHLVAVPESEDALRRGIGEAHRRYSRMINFREGWKGHLWQGRFSSFPMNEHYLLAAVRYVEMNPVRAQLVNSPEEWPWSSAQAHLSGRDDSLVRVKPLLDLVGNWKQFLGDHNGSIGWEEIRRHELSGRPLGEDSFVERLEQELGRRLHRQKPGPKSEQNQGHPSPTASSQKNR